MKKRVFLLLCLYGVEVCCGGKTSKVAHNRTESQKPLVQHEGKETFKSCASRMNSDDDSDNEMDVKSTQADPVHDTMLFLGFALVKHTTEFEKRAELTHQHVQTWVDAYQEQEGFAEPKKTF